MKTITIYRSKNKGGLDSSHYKLINEESRQYIGSYFKRNTNGSIGTGLTNEEERIVMPKLVNRYPDQDGFWDLVKSYFIDIRTYVPTEGLTLEIGLINDEKPLGAVLSETEINLPVNPDHWVRYKHAMACNRVAPSERYDKRSLRTKFYVEDPEEVTVELKENLTLKNQAHTLYISTLNKRSEIAPYILTMFGIFVDKDMMKDENMMWYKIDELKDKNPAKFIKIVEDKHLKNKYIIQTLINNKQIKRVGDKLMTKDNDPLGASTIDELASLMEEDENKGVVIKAMFENIK